jgi:DNA repair protein RecO (recombination protein O)
MATALSAEGIILRKYYLRETSYILVIFTREFGKIRGVIKGVRNPYPQFAGNFESLTRAQVLFYKKKKRPLDLITQCEALEYFVPARKDIERLTYASYFIELVDTVTTDHDENAELYDILIEGLRMLVPGSGAKRICRIFELKMLGALGFSPRMTECVRCSSKVDERASFNAALGGIMCAKCQEPGGMNIPVSLGTIKFIRKIQENDIRKTGQFKVTREVGIETQKILNSFVGFHINRPMRTMKFLGEMEKAGVIK